MHYKSYLEYCMLPCIYEPHNLNQTLNTVHLLVGLIQFIRFDKNLNFFVSDNFIKKKRLN